VLLEVEQVHFFAFFVAFYFKLGHAEQNLVFGLVEGQEAVEKHAGCSLVGLL